MDLAAVATGPFSPTDAHARLARLAGRWTGTAKTHADPSDPDAAESAPWEGTITMVLGGRFLRFVYASHAMGQPICGELTVAWEAGDRRFRMSWIDSLHTSPAILVSESESGSGDAGPIRAFGTYFAGEGQPRWGWRTELDDRGVADGVLRIRMFNVTPDGEATLGVAIDLTRE